jgi:hypothetical protein
MRVLAPLFVAATVVLFGSGVAMGILHGRSLQIARQLHGPTSVIWLALVAVHVLVYLGQALRNTARDALPPARAPVRGTVARFCILMGVLILGLVLAGATVPAQHRWVDLPRDHHDHHSPPHFDAAVRDSDTTSRSSA